MLVDILDDSVCFDTDPGRAAVLSLQFANVKLVAITRALLKIVIIASGLQFLVSFGVLEVLHFLLVIQLVVLLLLLILRLWLRILQH